MYVLPISPILVGTSIGFWNMKRWFPQMKECDFPRGVLLSWTFLCQILPLQNLQNLTISSFRRALWSRPVAPSHEGHFKGHWVLQSSTAVKFHRCCWVSFSFPHFQVDTGQVTKRFQPAHYLRLWHTCLISLLHPPNSCWKNSPSWWQQKETSRGWRCCVRWASGLEFCLQFCALGPLI